MTHNNKLRKITLSAMFAAMTCVATLIHIPVAATQGYVNFGDGIVLLSAFVLGPLYGAAAGGVGSMLADLLLGYASYAPGTLIIKAAMALFAGLIFYKNKSSFFAVISAVIGEIIMVLGYFLYESTILSYGLSATASILSNSLQGVVGAATAVLLYYILKRQGKLYE